MGRAPDCCHHGSLGRVHRLRTLLSILILGAAVVWVAWSVAKSGAPAEAAASTEVGAPAPNFDGTGLDRSRIRLADFAGRPLIINFFASWCDPCKEEAPVVKAMAAEASSKGFAVLGVAIQDERSAAAEFLASDGIAIPAILDDGAVARAYRIIGPPATYFIDAAGVIRYSYMGPLTPDLVETGMEQIAGGGAGASATAGAQAPSLALAAGLGLLSFLSPCVLPLLPAYMGYISGISAEEVAQGGPNRRSRAFVRILAFALGLILVFTALGASASLIGAQLTAYRSLLAKVSGILVLAFGLHMTGILHIPLLHREFRPGLNGAGRGGRGGPLGAVAMGAAFGLGWTPCVGPVLGTILVMAAQKETASQAVGLLLAYGLGMGLPFAITGLAMDRMLGALSSLRRHLGLIEKVSGALLMLMGLLLVADRLGALSNWLNRLV